MLTQIPWGNYVAAGRRGLLLVSRASKFLTLLLLVGVGGLAAFAQIKTDFTDQVFDLDKSWFLDLGYQLQQGHLIGRDTFFTYGPLAQVVVSLAALWQGSGSILKALSLGQFLVYGLGLVVLALCLGLIKQVRWTGALFIFLIMLALNLVQLRQLLVLLGVIVLNRALMAGAPARYWWAISAGGLWLAGWLFSLDTGFLALAAAVGLLLICLVLTLPWFTSWGASAGLLTRRGYLEVFAVALATLGLGFVALEIFFQLSSPTYHAFDYFQYGLRILLRYNYAMGAPWLAGQDPETIFSPVLFLTIAYTAGFALVSAWRGLQAGNKEWSHLLLGILLAAGFTFKSAVIRSDIWHLMMGVVILLFLFGLSLTFLNNQHFLQALGGSLLVLFLMTWPAQRDLNALDVLPQAASGRFALAAKWEQIRNIQLDPHVIASPRLQAAVDPQKIILDFPYDNVLAIALGQKSLAPVLQAYAAFDEGLQQNYVQAVARSRSDLEVIYGIDLPIDRVQTVSRTPLIFKYLVENFKLKTTDLFNGYAVLAPRVAPQPLALTPLVYTREPADQGFNLRLAQPARCSLVELELLIRYPLTSVLGRPTGLTIQAWNGENRLLENKLVAIETGRSFSTFLYLGRPERFLGVFDDQGRIETRATFDRLTLKNAEPSLFNVYPSQVAVQALRCVQPPTPPVERRAGEVEHLAPGETVQLNWYVSAEVSPEAFVRPVPTGIFMHPQDPDSELEFGPFIAPPNTCFFTRLTLDPEVAHHPEADGVEFSFTITAGQQIVNQQTNDLSPTDAAVPIKVAAPAGAPFTLRLQTAPRGTFDWDWAIWKNPRLGPCA
jgi:hypothetical protein